MWFKNLKLFRITQPLDYSEQDIQAKLAEFPFRPCGSQDKESMGWAAPIPKSDSLIHAAAGSVWITLKKQERILPASVVNAELDEKVAELESESGSPVNKKAKQELKEAIMQRLMPQAFRKNSSTHAFISFEHNLVVVDAASDAKAETLLAMLRKALGSLPVLPFCRSSLATELTQWLSSNGSPEAFEVLNEAELKSSDEEESIIRCKNQDLSADEVMSHLEAGKLVTKLAVKWDDTLSAVLQDDLVVKRLKFTDVLLEQNDDIPKDQLNAKLDADFALMSGELIRFAKALDDTFSL